MKVFNNYVDVKSFFRRGVKKCDDAFGVYLITGYQGTGKTYFGVYLLDRLKEKTKIYTNIHSLKLEQHDVCYFNTLDEIWDNIETDCIFLIDEISKKYTKDCKQDLKFYSWLQQSRKRRRIVLLITQEYLQVPMWLRGVVGSVFTTNKVPFLPIFYTHKGIPFLTEDMQWGVLPKSTYIYKRNKKIASKYDTFEPVPVL